LCVSNGAEHGYGSRVPLSFEDTKTASFEQGFSAPEMQFFDRLFDNLKD
jgi:hypothetical protein